MKKLGYFVLAAALTLGALSTAAPTRAQSPRLGASSIAGLIDVAVQNTSALNDAANVTNTLNNAINGNTLKIVNLNDTLNGNETNVLSGILNGSQVLTGNMTTVQNILNGDQVLTNFLNNNNIPLSNLVAVNVLGGSPTLYVFGPQGNGGH